MGNLQTQVIDGDAAAPWNLRWEVTPARRAPRGGAACRAPRGGRRVEGAAWRRRVQGWSGGAVPSVKVMEKAVNMPPKMPTI